MDFSIRPFDRQDFERVKEIYQQGIDTGIATFQTEAKDWPDWDQGLLQHSRLVAANENQVLGWAALSGVSDRCCYAGVAEVTVYIGDNAQGKGAGKALLEALVASSEKEGYWTLQAGIFTQNEASIALHKKCGFREIGVRRKIGKLSGRWMDTVLMERRSQVVGID